MGAFADAPLGYHGLLEQGQEQGGGEDDLVPWRGG